MTKPVRKTLAESPMTPARKRKLAQLSERPDSEIDFSDIPPLKDKLLEECRPKSVLPSGEAATHGAFGRRCGGLAASSGKGLSDQAQQGAKGSNVGRHQERPEV